MNTEQLRQQCSSRYHEHICSALPPWDRGRREHRTQNAENRSSEVGKLSQPGGRSENIIFPHHCCKHTAQAQPGAKLRPKAI